MPKGGYTLGTGTLGTPIQWSDSDKERAGSSKGNS